MNPSYEGKERWREREGGGGGLKVPLKEAPGSSCSSTEEASAAGNRQSGGGGQTGSGSDRFPESAFSSVPDSSTPQPTAAPCHSASADGGAQPGDWAVINTAAALTPGGANAGQR